MNETVLEQGRLLEVEQELDVLKQNTDHFFLIIIAIIIYFMQGGFALLEAGSVRSKNTVNILIKNLLDGLIGGVCYWAVGWGLAYGAGGNGFCGGSEFINYKLPVDEYPKWFFQYVFAATAATIVSGAIAERCQFGAYFAYSILITGWVFPVVSHWAWDAGDAAGVGRGWLHAAGFLDFAGGGVVHLTGGTCSLVGCYFVGYRLGRFGEHGEARQITGHSVPLAALGGFILIFGFLAFNGGSQGSISRPGDGAVVALAVVNTVLGACSGGLTVLFFYKLVLGQPWSFLMTLNGCLAGMVSVCAGCNLYQPWAALVVGAGAGVWYVAVHLLMVRCRLDDPLDAVAVHGAGGLWGLLCVPFFMHVNLPVGERGIFWDGAETYPWTALAYNLLGAVCISAWSLVWSSVIFGSLHYFSFLRVSADLEIQGLDILKHGEPAYPAPSWVEAQYRTDRKVSNQVSDIPANMIGEGTVNPSFSPEPLEKPDSLFKGSARNLYKEEQFREGTDRIQDNTISLVSFKNMDEFTRN